MADRVEKGDELRRLFAADVAHELRTPLAILRSQIEAIQDQIAEPTTQTIASLHEETLRLGRLIADLETLASADATAFTLQHKPLALEALVQETPHRCSPHARHSVAGHRMSWFRFSPHAITWTSRRAGSSPSRSSTGRSPI